MFDKKQALRAKIKAKIDTSPKDKVQYVAHEERLWGVPKDPEGFLEYWATQIAKLPKGAKDPSIELMCDDGYGLECIAVTLQYTQLETPEEVSIRVDRETEAELAKVQRKLAALQALKDKYEND